MQLGIVMHHESRWRFLSQSSAGMLCGTDFWARETERETGRGGDGERGGEGEREKHCPSASVTQILCLARKSIEYWTEMNPSEWRRPSPFLCSSRYVDCKFNSRIKSH